ncbi:MAG: hypothetical protein J0H65_14480 [Rhizobiales bacterium]|nr:hypothetical protein [Hyphomicrobiales bacterium]
MTASERSDGSGAKGKVVTLRGGQGGEAGVKKPVDPALVYFPDGLKRHYMDLLLRYKNQLSKESGKAVGWLAIRDRIMAREDALVAEAKQRSGYGVKVDRPRSDLVRLDDFKGWYNPKNSHLPTDPKFQYIDRFIRGLRVNGLLDVVEREVSSAKREYHRECLAIFYHPQNAFQGNEPSGFQSELARILDSTIFAAYCRPQGDDPSFERQYLLLLFCHAFKGNISPVDVVACVIPPGLEAGPLRSGSVQTTALECLRRFDTLSSRLIYLYSGFIVLERYGLGSPMRTPGASASLALSSPTGASVSQSMLTSFLPRHFNPRVFLFPTAAEEQDASIPVNAAIAWPAEGVELFRQLGVEIISQSTTYWIDRPRSDPLAGFVQVSERGPQYVSLLELRDKFAIGYRPC